MATENNENTKKGSAEQNGAAPKKKLSIVFRKQNASGIKELPKGLRNAAAESSTRKKGSADKPTRTAENSGSQARRPRPLPAGTKPVRPVLKELEENEAAKTVRSASDIKPETDAKEKNAVKAETASGIQSAASELKAENPSSASASAAIEKPETTASVGADISIAKPDAEAKETAKPEASKAEAIKQETSDAAAEQSAKESPEKSEEGINTAAEAKQAAKDSAEAVKPAAKTEDTAVTAEKKADTASEAAQSHKSDASEASDAKSDDKAHAAETAESKASGDSSAQPEKKPEERRTLAGAGDIIPKVKIVKSYANYNAAEVIAEASRQARQAAANKRDAAKRQDTRRDGAHSGRPQGANGRPGSGDNRGRDGQQGGFRNRNGESGGRTFIVRGNAASDGGRNGNAQGTGSRFGGNASGRRPGSGAGAAAPAFDNASGKNGRGNNRNASGRNDRKDRKDKFVDSPANLKNPKTGKGAFVKPEPKKEKPEDEVKLIVIPETLTIKDLADKLKMQPSVIVKKLFLAGKMVTPNTELSYEEAEEIAIEYDILCEKEVQEDVIAELLKEDEENPEDLVVRNPVVCVMGHVDHGKTSLLDAIRNTNVTSHEAGGITQHIGASVVRAGDRYITFLDTPGHEAFTAMRLRGAQSTDIAVLVVAADDGVKPQTIEAISHAKAAGVEVVVAINKMDKPAANADLVKSQLTEYGLVAEDYGGSTPMVPVSAKSGEGIADLLDMILLEADVLELKANPNRKARGLVIEAQLDKGRGPVATVLVQKGTLKVGDNVVAGSCYGKVRAMLDDKGNRIRKAGPSYPAEILGLNDVPNAGEVFMVCADEKEARAIAETFISEQKKHMLEETKQKMNLDDLFDEIKAGNVKELPIIVKADVQGSVEAVKQSLGKLSNEEVAVKVIHAAAGNINESDVTLASTANAIIIGFNVKPDATAKATAEHEKVDMRLYKVIYQAIDDLQAALTGMLAPVYEEKDTGRAIVRQIFKASNVGNIAGCYVTEGVVERGSKARVMRGDKKVFDGDIASLKRFKDEVKEVKTGFECGIVLEDFQDVQVDDVLEIYKMVQVARGEASAE